MLGVLHRGSSNGLERKGHLPEKNTKEFWKKSPQQIEMDII